MQSAIFKFDEVRRRVQGDLFQIFKKWSGVKEVIKVSEFRNADPMRGSAPGFFGIQSYYSDGSSVRAFEFEEISLVIID